MKIQTGETDEFKVLSIHVIGSFLGVPKRSTHLLRGARECSPNFKREAVRFAPKVDSTL